MTDPASARLRVDELLRRRDPAGPQGAVAALEGLCRAVSEELGLVGATVSLMPGVGVHAVCAASSPTARRLDEAQFGVGEGPARDAFATRRPVLVPDLAITGTSRWPGWTPTVRSAGVGGVHAFPLHVGAAFLGVLSLYVADAGPLDAAGIVTATVFAEVATELLVDGSLGRHYGRLESDLGAMLDTHAYVYQAQGMVMVELGVSLAEALALMRAHAWATGLDLTTLAGDIVAGRTMPPGGLG